MSDHPTHHDFERALDAVLDSSPLAYHASLARALNSVTAGVLLSQFLYWSKRTKDAEGYFYKTRDDIYEETALTRTEQETARKRLRELGVITEKLRGVPAKMHFHVNKDRLVKLLADYDQDHPQSKAGRSARAGRGNAEPNPTSKMAETTPTSWRESCQLDGGKAANRSAEKPPAITETTQETTAENNNTVGVVTQLTEQGITRRTALRLAETYEATYIESKIDLVRWLREHQPRTVGKNAAGFLRRALEEDYQPPATYQTAEQRQAAVEAKARRQAQLDAIVAAQQEQETKAKAAEVEKKAQALSAIRHEYPPAQIPGTELTTETAWQKVLQRLQDSMTAANYQTWLAETILASCNGSTGIVVAPSTFVADWLRSRFNALIRKELQQILGFPVQLEYLALSDLADPEHPQQPELTGESTTTANTSPGNGKLGTRTKRNSTTRPRARGSSLHSPPGHQPALPTQPPGFGHSP